MFLRLLEIKIRLQFLCSCQMFLQDSSGWYNYTERCQLSMVLIEFIFCYNSAKYEANFIIIYLLLLIIISALNLLKRFPPHFNCIVTLLC